MRSEEDKLAGYDARDLLREFTRALDSDRGALFCGAGTSMAAGFVNWRDLLKDIADDLDLDIDFVTDLISLAQYSDNKRGRQHINELIIDEFVKIAKRNPLQDLLVRLPVEIVWTTNYDSTLEETYRSQGRVPEVKVNEATLSAHKRNSDVTIYKMHGDSARPDEAVLTKEDYEMYAYTKRGQAFATALQAALMSHTFLFVGFSFTDPNIDQIFGRIRAIVGENRRRHYCVMKRPETPTASDAQARAKQDYDWKRTALQIEDLERRYGIHTTLVDSYDEIAGLIDHLVRASRRNSVFVSGAVEDREPFGRDRLQSLLSDLGARLESDGKTLVSGMGLEVGGHVVYGFFQSAYARGEAAVTERAILRPFPQAVPGGGNIGAFWHTYRQDMISRAGFAIYLAGNKRSGEEIVLSEGMMKEFEIACDMDVVPIPIGATGYVARQIWELVASEPDRYFPSDAKIGEDIAMIGDAANSNERILDAVFAIMQKINRARGL